MALGRKANNRQPSKHKGEKTGIKRREKAGPGITPPNRDFIQKPRTPKRGHHPQKKQMVISPRIRDPRENTPPEGLQSEMSGERKVITSTKPKRTTPAYKCHRSSKGRGTRGRDRHYNDPKTKKGEK